MDYIVFLARQKHQIHFMAGIFIVADITIN